VLNDAGQLQQDSQDIIAAFVRGEPVELHQVMAAAEEASISLELLVEIRNKLTDAYRAVMNMQA
jgi:flagellar hook-basal body complex protein FliE